MPAMRPMYDWTLKLAQTMLSKVNNDSFMHTSIVGERNYGKTYYALKNMAFVYYKLNDGAMSETDCYKMALDDVIFTPMYFKSKVRYNRENSIKSPFFLLDDAGVHFDSGLHNRNMYLYQLLNACLDTIKDVTNCLIVTCPYKEVLTKRLREYDGYDVTLYMNVGYERYGTCIKWYRRPTGDRRWRKMFEDAFSCYIPTPIHKEYLELRNKFTVGILDELDYLERKYEEIRQKKLSVKTGEK